MEHTDHTRAHLLPHGYGQYRLLQYAIPESLQAPLVRRITSTRSTKHAVLGAITKEHPDFVVWGEGHILSALTRGHWVSVKYTSAAKWYFEEVEETRACNKCG